METPRTSASGFAIPSTGWKAVLLPCPGIPGGLPAISNPEGDVWEVRAPDGRRAQLFTWGAALRETSAAGLRLPSVLEWLDAESLARTEGAEPPLAGFPRAGSLHVRGGTLLDYGDAALVWAALPDGTGAAVCS